MTNTDESIMLKVIVKMQMNLTSDSSPRTQMQAALRLKPSWSYILVEFGFSFTILSTYNVTKKKWKTKRWRNRGTLQQVNTLTFRPTKTIIDVKIYKINWDPGLGKSHQVFRYLITVIVNR